LVEIPYAEHYLEPAPICRQLYVSLAIAIFDSVGVIVNVPQRTN